MDQLTKLYQTLCIIKCKEEVPEQLKYIKARRMEDVFDGEAGYMSYLKTLEINGYIRIDAPPIPTAFGPKPGPAHAQVKSRGEQVIRDYENKMRTAAE